MLDKKDVWYVLLLLFMLADAVFVTSFIKDYYPKFEFFYWVTELVLVAHIFSLVKRRKCEWKRLFFLDYIENYFPSLFCGSKKLRQMLYICIVAYWIALPLVPTLAVALAMKDGQFVMWVSDILFGQWVLTLIFLAVVLIRKWRSEGERKRTRTL